MILPPLWVTGGEYDERTGFPIPSGPIHLQIDERYRHKLGYEGDPVWMATEVTARTIAIPSHDGSLERQVRDAGVIFARAPKGSHFMVSRRIFPMGDTPEAAWIEAVCYFPANAEIEDRSMEVFGAIMSGWNSWWMADDLAGTGDAPMPVLSRAVGLVNAGVHWRTALSMAALEQELEPRK